MKVVLIESLLTELYSLNWNMAFFIFSNKEHCKSQIILL